MTLQPLSRKLISFPAEILPYLSGVWTNGETLFLPCFSVSPDERSCQFLTFEQDEQDSRWSVLYQDLFAGGGADGDSESFDTFEEAVQSAQDHAAKCCFDICETVNA